MDEKRNPKAGTRAVWAGEKNEMWEHSTQIPIVQSVSFGYYDLDEALSSVAR